MGTEYEPVKAQLTRPIRTDFLGPRAICVFQSLHLGDANWTGKFSSKLQ
jgi:hypothetical protein